MSRARDIANLQSGGVINDGSADLDFRVESNGNANILFVDGGNDAVVVGHNNANDGSVSSAFALQQIGTSYNSSSVGLARFSADVNAPTIAFHKSRHASIGGDTVVQDNDELGRIRFFGNDGTDFAEGARITALVNGTPGGGDMPSELVFSTSADGAESPTARLTLNSAGTATFSGVLIANGNIEASTGGPSTYNDITDDNAGLVLGSSSADNSGIVIRTGTSGVGSIYFGDNSGSAAQRKMGYIQYSHSTDDMTIQAEDDLRLYANEDIVMRGTTYTFDSEGGAAEFMRIDTDGNFMVGKTSVGYAGDGFEARASGYASVSDTSSTPFLVNLNGDDGSLINFYKAGASVGSIGFTSDGYYIDGQSNHIGLRMFASTLGSRFNGSDNDGGVDLGWAGGRWQNLYLIGGVYLGGTGSSNKLDDYEEGTWTPSVHAGAISGTSISYEGTYTKIGRLVFISFKATSSSADINVSSYVQFSGVPFTIANIGTASVTTEDIDQFDRQGFAELGNTYLTLSNCGSASDTSTLKVGIVGSTS